MDQIAHKFHMFPYHILGEWTSIYKWFWCENRFLPGFWQPMIQLTGSPWFFRLPQADSKLWSVLSNFIGLKTQNLILKMCWTSEYVLRIHGVGPPTCLFFILSVGFMFPGSTEAQTPVENLGYSGNPKAKPTSLLSLFFFFSEHRTKFWYWIPSGNLT